MKQAYKPSTPRPEILCMIMFKCLRRSAPTYPRLRFDFIIWLPACNQIKKILYYLADYCISTSLVPGRSSLRSAAHGVIVVPRGLRYFAVAGPSSWNVLPVGLRSSSFSLETFAKLLKTSIWFSALTTEHALLSLYYISQSMDSSLSQFPDCKYWYEIIEILKSPFPIQHRMQLLWKAVLLSAMFITVTALCGRLGLYLTIN